jgi:Cu(I)/Ag(I) efflux system periplasmic protein CusF
MKSEIINKYRECGRRLSVLGLALSLLLALPGCEQETPMTTGLEPPPPPESGTTMPVPTQMTHAATGIVTAIDPQAKRITIAHDPVPSLNWASMTMSFVIDASLLDKVQTGDKVTFTLVDSNGQYAIQDIRQQ